LLLLANHGVLSVGTDVFAALNKLESVENAAKILTIAKIVGDGKYADLPDEEVQVLMSL
jgi:L-fuculose-phosphate aldolase